MTVILKFMLIIIVRRVLMENTLYSVYQPRGGLAVGGLGGNQQTGLENVSKIKRNISVKIK